MLIISWRYVDRSLDSDQTLRRDLMQYNVQGLRFRCGLTMLRPGLLYVMRVLDTELTHPIANDSHTVVTSRVWSLVSDNYHRSFPDAD